MKNHKGFSVVEALLILIIVGLLGFIGWDVWQTKQNSDKSLKNASKTATISAEKKKAEVKPVLPIPEGYVKYENSALGFSFAYPKDWTSDTLTSDDTKYGVIIGLISPQQKKRYEDAVARLAQTGEQRDVPDDDLKVSFWSSIKDRALGKTQYHNLKDYLNNGLNGTESKIGQVTINGVLAYEVEIAGIGQSYGIMVERPKGIYRFNFINAWDKSRLTDQLKKIIDTISFE